uniref:CMP/dCMP-type deaminase domain-containing protein n=1 Tax=Lactuca sativa TaxID=4236 RepID=A0A9R1VIF3_LACSA|nr:hypothetical protein LSAT_V11C500269730 [Lactuca sativa]
MGEEMPEIVAFMKLALLQSYYLVIKRNPKIAFDNLEVPVGCVIVMDGKVISCGRNQTNETRNATRHAEMEAIDVLLKEWKEKELTKHEVVKMFSNCSLYVTCEPCIMCASALSFIGTLTQTNTSFIGTLSFSKGPIGEYSGFCNLPRGEDVGRKSYKCTGGIMGEEAVSLFRNFYELGNSNGMYICIKLHIYLLNRVVSLSNKVSPFVLYSPCLSADST